MSRFLITSLIASIVLFAPAQDRFTLTEMVRNYDPVKDLSTVTMPPEKLSGPKGGPYHSLTFSISYSHPGQEPAPPKEFNLELISVVKARTLNSDLYVVFVVDGKEIHFSSNRSAIRNPVPGKLWIGERMMFKIPHEDFKKLASGTKLGVKLGGVSFSFTDSQIMIMKIMSDPDSFSSGPPQTSPHRL